ncbi:MAG TPA: class I SAM-dependent methyltransferase [Actinomycetota bacterium]|jgi:hypothetical protein
MSQQPLRQRDLGGIHRIWSFFSTKFRIRRMERFAQKFGIGPETRVLDVGGTEFNWRMLPERIRPSVVVLNIKAPKVARTLPQATWVLGDATNLPFRDDAFDVVFSNAVLEHVGQFGNQRRFAEECRRVGRRYFVQTPNQGFVVEPHLVTPFIHWLPRETQRRLMRNFTVWGLLQRPTQQECDDFLDEVWMVRKRQMRTLFPDGEIESERFMGMSKALVAVGPRTGIARSSDRPATPATAPVDARSRPAS